MDHKNVADLYARHRRLVPSTLEVDVAAVDWPAERIHAVRQQRLRTLLETAKRKAPWHAARLAHLDPARATEADLADVPPMTKDDLMSAFDGIVTDPRTTRAAAEEHLGRLEEGDRYFEGEFRVVASGGSSGQRGVFVWGWEPWTHVFTGLIRMLLRDQRRCGETQGPVRMAMVAASSPTHMTAGISASFGGPELTRVPVTLPLAEIIAALERLRPELLVGYTSMLGVLAREQLAGRLSIAPRRVSVTSEPLLPEIRAALVEALGGADLQRVGDVGGRVARRRLLRRGGHARQRRLRDRRAGR